MVRVERGTLVHSIILYHQVKGPGHRVFGSETEGGDR